jgi:2-dehydropantoate 2-reductase
LLGPDPDHSGFVPERALDLLRRVGIQCRWFDDPRPALWEKYLFISAFGLATTASRKTLGTVLADPDLMEDVRGVMDEVVRIARSAGVHLGPDAVDDALSKARGFPPDTKTSYQRDVEAGRHDEGDLFGATILRLGRQYGTPTPHAERLLARVLEGQK